MALRFDPNNLESKALKSCAGDFQQKSVLEIGSGSGRLTWLYGHEALQVVAIDPNVDRIATAVKETPPQLADRITFEHAGLEEFNTEQRFDLVILGWSL